MSLSDGDYYIFDKFSQFVTANTTDGGPPVMATFIGTNDQQWHIIGGQGVAQFLRNIRYETYIGFLNHSTTLTTSPIPWYINETTDTDWYQISRDSNQGGPFWVANGEVSNSQNGSLTLNDGGFYSWFFLPVSQVSSNGSSATTMLSSLIGTATSGLTPDPTESISTQNPTSSSKNDMSPKTIGAIVGGVVGGILLLSLIILGARLLARQSRGRSEERKATQTMQSPAAFTLQEPIAVTSDRISTVKPTSRPRSPPPYEESTVL
ncbi:hypothetical protein VKT23_014170 [Stygiomarasmius scandens]|uniref:Uncharacterized protein n=1 Tax=Marasmiellus scandens TaxID=2682957 RepID=A0ABR1J652_9AGAR